MQAAPTQVLLADDESKTLDLMGAALQALGFQVALARTPREAIQILKDQPIDAVVTDVVFDGAAAGEEILLACRDLRPKAAVVLMTGYPAIEGAVSAIREGAFDYLQKPVEPTLLADTLRRAMSERSLYSDSLEFQDLVNILSDMVAATIERVDPYTAGHGERTRCYCRQIAQDLGLDPHVTERLELAAIAHDYGKIYLDDLTFLTKKGPLTPGEYREVQRHPELGAKKLGDNQHLREVCLYVAEHHERWDGTGYPLRRKEKEISAPGRILGVVEVFDSLSTKRSYKDPWDLTKTMDFFEAQAGRAFDPEVVDVFTSLMEVHGEEWIAAPKRDQIAAGLSV